MRVSPITFNYFGCKKKNNAVRLSQTKSPISFNAKIPDEYKAREQYRPLLYPALDTFSSTQLANGKDTEEIIGMVKSLGYDRTVSKKFKSSILIGKDENPLFERVKSINPQTASILSEPNHRIARAILTASPDKETTKALLLTPSGSWGIPLNAAKDKETVKMLLKASPDDKTLLAQLNYKDENGTSSFINATTEIKDAMLECCSDDIKNVLLSDEGLYKSTSASNYSKYLSQISDNNALLNTLFIKISKHQNADTDSIRPVIGYLQPNELLNIISGIKDTAVKKEILLKNWNDVEKSPYGFTSSESSTSNILRRLKEHSDKGKLADIVYEVIEDKSTDTTTAIKLLEKYEKAVPTVTQQSFKELLEHFKQQAVSLL